MIIFNNNYNNNGEISFITSLTLSLISNTVSSIIIYIISKLADHPYLIELILKNVKDKNCYLMNIIRDFKFIRIKLAFFFVFELILGLLMIYYMFIFCVVFHKSQGSIMYNYFIGICLSLAKSVGLTIAISTMRNLSIKYKKKIIFNTSKYLYDHF